MNWPLISETDFRQLSPYGGEPECRVDLMNKIDIITTWDKLQFFELESRMVLGTKFF